MTPPPFGQPEIPKGHCPDCNRKLTAEDEAIGICLECGKLLPNK